MNSKDVLEKIVKEKGSCDWATVETCRLCPMSRLRFREDGNPLSCVDALNVESVPADMRDARYERAALRLLADLAIDDILKE